MLFLYDVQSPVNIGLTLRAAEQFRQRVAFFDPRRVLSDEEKLPTISDFSCGALHRQRPEVFESLISYRTKYPGRLVATSLSNDAFPLHEFSFRPTDTIILGNEYDGLPHWLIDHAEARITIPLPDAVLPKPKSYSAIDPSRINPPAQDGVPNLNVSTAAAIISYAWRMQEMLEQMDNLSAQAVRTKQDQARTG